MNNKMDKLEEMDKFLEMHNLLILSQPEIENKNRPITSNDIESVIKNKQRKKLNKSPGPDDFIYEFYQTLKEEVTSILLRLFQKFAKEGTHPNSFMRPASPWCQIRYYKERKKERK